MPDESQKEREKGTDIKILGFKPARNVNPLVLETLLASFLGSPSLCTQFILLPIFMHIIYSHDLCSLCAQ